MGHFLAALLGKLCADEIKAWLPSITQRIIWLAVLRLPEDQRDRYSEEWQSHLDEVPGEIARLWTACGFFIAVKRVSQPHPAIQALWSSLVLISSIPLLGLVWVLVRITKIRPEHETIR